MTSKEKVSVSRESSYWKEHIEAWQASGKTQAEYCRQHELKLKAFAYRKRRFDKSPAKPIFHPVRIIEEEAKVSPSLSLMIGSRYCIEVRDGFNPVTLRQIVEMLER
ncbi:MAG: hypothetical protein L7F77_08110 [Candidatus Magnetominusculus sp. LBB02]|nr:hypothetical protein [Candidatus Magnetominusculus sp. LBB02]